MSVELGTLRAPASPPPVSLAPRACTLCGSTAARPMSRPQPQVTYYECPCGVTWPNPFPTPPELERIYAEGYMDLELPGHGLHLRFKPEYAEIFRRERDLTLRDLDVDPTTLAGRRILDVGCANGIFLHYLCECGAHGVGIDVSKEMVDAARGRGLEAYQIRLEGLEDQAASWDVVTLWDVIEHLPDPRDAVRRIHRLLRSAGELWIQTPCTGLVSEAFGDHWRNFIWPQHVHLFSEPGLVRLLDEEGFDVIRRVRFGSGNTAGTIPAPAKRAADRVAKASGHGDTIALRARRR